MVPSFDDPMIVAGQGVFFHKAWDALKKAAEKNEIAVVESGPVRGHFGDEHRLSANLAADSLGSVDLVVFVGQYLMPNVGEYRFNPDYALRLNLYNLADRHYIDQIHPFRAVPGAGRSATLTLEMKL